LVIILCNELLLEEMAAFEGVRRATVGSFIDFLYCLLFQVYIILSSCFLLLSHNVYVTGINCTLQMLKASTCKNLIPSGEHPLL
jgi:hypothetical protein